jgi:hypothetical protein
VSVAVGESSSIGVAVGVSSHPSSVHGSSPQFALSPIGSSLQESARMSLVTAAHTALGIAAVSQADTSKLTAQDRDLRTCQCTRVVCCIFPPEAPAANAPAESGGEVRSRVSIRAQIRQPRAAGWQARAATACDAGSGNVAKVPSRANRLSPGHLRCSKMLEVGRLAMAQS